MRTKEEIKKEIIRPNIENNEPLFLEVLLDIRDLLDKKSGGWPIDLTQEKQ